MFAKLKLPILLATLSITAQLALANPEDFTVNSATDTNVFKLSDARGKYVAVHFLLKTECPFCLKHTRTYSEKSMGDSRVIHIFLKPDSEAEIKSWTMDLGGAASKLTVYRDPDAKLADGFGIPGGYKFHGEVVHYPALVLLDPKGNEVFRYVGKNNTDRYPYEKFSAKLDELMMPPAMSAMPGAMGGSMKMGGSTNMSGSMNMGGSMKNGGGGGN